MVDCEFWLEVDGSSELERVAAALAEVAKFIPDDIDDKIHDVAVDMAEDAARKIQSLRMKDPGNERTRHTRRRIAKGLRVVPLKEGGRRIITTVDDFEERMLPRGFDSPMKGWRHPTFGRTGPGDWVRQYPAESWFRDVVDDAAHILPDKLEETLEFAADWVDDAS